MPYYRRLFAAHGIVPDEISSFDDFRRIPPIDRRTVREQAVQLPAGSLPLGTVPLDTLHTSGTTGIPIDVPQTNVTQTWWAAFTLRDLHWCGIDPRGRLAAIRPSGWRSDVRGGISSENWGERLDSVVHTGPSHLMDIVEDPREQLAWLRRIQPDYLLSYPSNLEALSSLLLESGDTIPKVRAIQSIGETATETTQDRIERAFGVRPRNTYSACEAGYIASPCPDHQGLHVHAENVVLELLDADGNPCQPGEAGRVVLTTLHNFRFPFIRYDIDDEAEWADSACPCGRGLPLLRRVRGKRRPMLRLPTGRLKNAAGLAIALRHIGGFHQYQVLHRATGAVRLRVVPDATWTFEHSARLERAIHDFFEAPIAVQVEPAAVLERSRGGKLIDFVVE